jgi:hypothetical protein
MTATPPGLSNSVAKQGWLEALRVLVLIVALGLILLGFVASCVGIAAGLLGDQTDPVATATFAASVLALTLGLGLALAWHAWRAAQGYASLEFHPRRVGPWLLLYVLVLALGQIVLSFDLLPFLTFPPLHIAAASLPVIVILVLVARGLASTSTWRDLGLQVASGAILSTGIAFLLEGLVILGVLGTALVGVALRPDGRELIQRLTAILEDPSWLQDPGLLIPALTSPLLVSLAFALFAIVVPLIEEAVKTVGVGLRAYKHPTMAQCYLWGLAGGAGFALVEGLLNTLGGIESWAPVIVLRAGATLLHCTTGALMGLAWYHALVSRRWRNTLGLYLASVISHGLWNAVSAGMTLVSLREISSASPNAGQLSAGMGVLTLLVILLSLVLGMGVALTWLTSYVRRASCVETTMQSDPPILA